MRIISKEKDYYDTVISFGYEKTDVPYVRDNKLICTVDQYKKHELLSYFMIEDEFSKRPSLALDFREDVWIPGRREAFINVNPFVIIFCGVPYRGVEINYHRYFSLSTEEETDIFYSLSESTDYLTKLNTSPELFRRTMKFLNNWFNYQKLDLTDISIKYKSPVILIKCNLHRHEIFMNIILKHFKFFKVKQAFETFQEIDMFVSGIMAPESKPMVVTDDKYKIMAHGFDKYSFRKMKANGTA